MNVKRAFYSKHAASAAEMMKAIFSATSILADLRTQAASIAARSGAEEIKAVAQQLDCCCAAVVRLVSKLPVEILMTIYETPNPTQHQEQA
jgi:hypothetical protein